jgi:RNA polymerase sigma-70 factor (ECF subfamily)
MVRSKATAQQPVTDAELEAAIAAGDKRGALTLLMDRHGDDIHRYAVSMTRDPQLAEEIRQQVFVEAYRDLGHVSDVSAFGVWIFGIARHRCIDAVNARKKWYQRYKNDAPDEIEPADSAPDHPIDRDLDRARMGRILSRCLHKLARAAREAVVLRYVQSLPYDEVATIVGDRAGTVQRRVARALPVLRKCVEANLHGESP